MDIDEEWSNFISLDYDKNEIKEEEKNNILNKCDNIDLSIKENDNIIIPEPSELYISTKSKIAYLTEPIDLNIFWNIKIINYSSPQEGVIKKQIKINSKSLEDLELINKKLKNEYYYDVQIINHIDNPNGRIKFKDIRKVTIGISKKDILSFRSKKKQAFYNCFVLILRLRFDNLFKEFHVKIFNTGKLEIPGVQNETQFKVILEYVANLLQPFISNKLFYKENSTTVLINSNFNCGYYINREKLYDILKIKYNIHAIYDPCSYPGIQCKFYYNKETNSIDNDTLINNSSKIKTKRQIKKELKDGNFTNINEVSFMIFRTGSVLIVGMCEDEVLINIYNYLKEILKTEYLNICQKNIDNSEKKEKINLKNKKRIIKKYIDKNIEDIVSVSISHNKNKDKNIQHFNHKEKKKEGTNEIGIIGIKEYEKSEELEICKNNLSYDEEILDYEEFIIKVKK